MIGMAKTIAFGELLLRLSPEQHKRFVQADRFDVVYGGGEANTAVLLAELGEDVAFVSKLPEHAIGQAALNELRRYGVDTQYVLRGGKRIGIYFLENGAAQRASKVIYDRAGSSFAEASPEEFDWDKIFKDAKWFHFTGITPALGEAAAESCLRACQAARERHIPISFDPNYRSSLWSRDKAFSLLDKIMPYVDLCISNPGQAADVFGIPLPLDESEDSEREACRQIARQLCSRYGCRYVALTRRRSVSASDNDFSAMLYADGECFFSRSYSMHIVDRVGGGDSFAAGLIYALQKEFSYAQSIEFAAAASCLKHSIPGDACHTSAEEILHLASGGGTLIQR